MTEKERSSDQEHGDVKQIHIVTIIIIITKIDRILERKSLG